VRSSDRSRPGGIWLGWAILGAGALAVSRIQPWLADNFVTMKNRNDVYALPNPEQVVGLSLGYRAALADLLFAHVLVYYGIHFQEKRRFEFIGNYLDTIVALDPRYRDAYRYADTLFTLQPEPARPEDYYRAREFMVRGMNEFPDDGDLWLTAGQFFAYFGPSYFKDAATQREWRLEGARRMARACELAGDDRNLPHQCIGAAGILSREGEREAMIRFLESVLAVSDDPEIITRAERALDGYRVDRAQVGIRARNQAFEKLRRRQFAHLDKDALLVLVPPFDPAACAGVPPPKEERCATSWREWAARQAE
jgi:tetratricopeptide (TPR) repeat protein